MSVWPARTNIIPIAYCDEDIEFPENVEFAMDVEADAVPLVGMEIAAPYPHPAEAAIVLFVNCEVLTVRVPSL